MILETEGFVREIGVEAIETTLSPTSLARIYMPGESYAIIQTEWGDLRIPNPKEQLLPVRSVTVTVEWERS